MARSLHDQEVSLSFYTQSHFSQASRDKGCACHAHGTLADVRSALTSPGSAFVSKLSHRDKGT